MRVGKISTSILVIIPAGSKATKGLESGRASGHKKHCHKKGYHDWSPQKADPCSGEKALIWCDDDCLSLLNSEHQARKQHVPFVKVFVSLGWN